MIDGKLLTAMEHEHCLKEDSTHEFSTSNGIENATPKLEWEFVVSPKVTEADRYVERGGSFRDEHKDLCRKPEPLSMYEAELKKINAKLEDQGQPPVITEELIGGRLYTGPMYEKYDWQHQT